MVVLDANVIIAAIDQTDAHHEVIKRFLSCAEDDFGVPALTLAEALVVPVRLGLAERTRADLSSSGVRELPCDQVGALDLARLRATTGLRMPDCLVLTFAMAFDAKLATTDQRLAREASRAGVELAL